MKARAHFLPTFPFKSPPSQKGITTTNPAIAATSATALTLMPGARLLPWPSSRPLLLPSPRLLPLLAFVVGVELELQEEDQGEEGEM